MVAILYLLALFISAYACNVVKNFINGSQHAIAPLGHFKNCKALSATLMTFRAIVLCVLLLPGAITALRKRVKWETPWCTDDHSADLTKPMEQVVRENPGADMFCYFEKAGAIYSNVPGHDVGLRLWVHPSSPPSQPVDYKQKSMESLSPTWGLKHDPATCADGWKGDNTGPLVTNYFVGKGKNISTHLDCAFYAYDDFYMYSLGWLRGQGRIDGRKLTNATAWEEQAANECRK
jgi:hypothetical protein